MYAIKMGNCTSLKNRQGPKRLIPPPLPPIWLVPDCKKWSIYSGSLSQTSTQTFGQILGALGYPQRTLKTFLVWLELDPKLVTLSHLITIINYIWMTNYNKYGLIQKKTIWPFITQKINSQIHDTLDEKVKLRLTVYINWMNDYLMHRTLDDS